MSTNKHTSAFDEANIGSYFCIVPNAAPAPALDPEEPMSSSFKPTNNSYRAVTTSNRDEQPSNPAKLHNTPPPPPMCCGMLSLKHCCYRLLGLLIFVGITVGAAALVVKAVSKSNDSVVTTVVTVEPAKDVVGATPAPIDSIPTGSTAPPSDTYPPGITGSENPPQVDTQPPTPAPTNLLTPTDGNGDPSPSTIPPQLATQPPTPLSTSPHSPTDGSMAPPKDPTQPPTPLPTYPPVHNFPPQVATKPPTPISTFPPTHSGGGMGPPMHTILPHLPPNFPPNPVDGVGMAPPLHDTIPPQDDDGTLHHPPPPHWDNQLPPNLGGLAPPMHDIPPQPPQDVSDGTLHHPPPQLSEETAAGCDEKWHNSFFWDHHDSPAHALDLWEFGGSALCKNDFDAQCKANAWTRFAVYSGTGSMWIKAKAKENSICPGNVEHLITLTVPQGDDYDLKVYKSTPEFHQDWPNAEPDFFSNTNIAGRNEEVLAFSTDGPEKDDFEYYIFVSYRSGTTCAPWNLAIDGHDCWDSNW